MKNNESVQEIALFGGTFDPIHIGHLRIAYELHQTGFFDKFSFMPCYQPVHKEAERDVSVQVRLAMLESALEDTPFTVERAEIDREGPSYAVDTLEGLKKAQVNQRFYFVMGSDSLLSFHKWHRFQRLLELTHLIVVGRPGFDIDEKSAVMEYVKGRQASSLEQLKAQDAGLVYMSPLTMLAISSTDLRERLQKNESIRYLVPSAVEKMILQSNCYREKKT
ncbi:nicotinate-nucleotide adenylyltransferase [Piscirickettsia litoralis]|uniref:Probable nicotinate-nucleotide adenylyltransferase n=1 Tax=Piscirickettsia litoralis TaxID=1891921 RepID=A0ABX3A3F6_9GAMM|nr:nicotinate-nucleotide adenylyltransferase [Piscirickettsia litoralis]ODN42772.1 nicotinate (nicotinamide) nucleotide adenylyltransferase [Piscirickettsia litoralis]